MSNQLRLWVESKLPFNLLLWVGVLLPLFSGTVAGMPRFTTVMFPLFMLVGGFLAVSRWRFVFLAASFLVQVAWFRLWLSGDPITC
ncbi:MAG TPA: hypothetical protein PKD45_15125 [Flavobacteriales bacterium]|nr:hypothetical protein [Flavobacteriales bacterium]